MWLVWMTGCAISNGVDVPVCENEPLPEVTEVPTWHDGISTIVAEKCATCHQQGGIGPMAFERYAETAPWAAAIASTVESRQMPP